ncbi:MAG: efflux RND transporter periplasmic adaptor subunit [bacterium]
MKKIFNKLWKIIASLVVVVAIAGVSIYYIFFNKPAAQIRYITSQVVKGQITQTVGASGTIESVHQKNLGFGVGGKIAQIDVKVGDGVKAGQQLAKLDTTNVDNTVAQSQSALAQAWNNYNSRTTTNKYAVDNLLQQINSAQAKANQDIASQQNAILKSDFDGTITKISNQVGDSVSASGNTSITTSGSTSTASSGVMTVVDFSSLQVRLTVPESDVVKIKTGQITQVIIDALSGKQQVGKVASVNNLGTITSNVVSYDVVIALDKPDPDIKPSMNATVSILVETKDNILSAPSGAVKTVGGQKTVQILVGGQPQTVTVETGLIGDSNTEITSGLNEGDNVITSTIRPTTSNTSSAGAGLLNLGGGTASRAGGGAGTGGGFTRPTGN